LGFKYQYIYLIILYKKDVEKICYFPTGRSVGRCFERSSLLERAGNRG